MSGTRSLARLARACHAFICTTHARDLAQACFPPARPTQTAHPDVLSGPLLCSPACRPARPHSSANCTHERDAALGARCVADGCGRRQGDKSAGAPGGSAGCMIQRAALVANPTDHRGRSGRCLPQLQHVATCYGMLQRGTTLQRAGCKPDDHRGRYGRCPAGVTPGVLQ